MIRAAVLLAALFRVVPAAAQTVHIAAFEGSAYHLSLTIINPFERMLRDGGTGFALVRVENVDGSFNGDEYRYLLPESLLCPDRSPLAEGSPEADVEYLETSGGLFVLTPGSGALLDRFLEVSRDQESYPMRRVPAITRGGAKLRRAASPDGGETHVLRLPPADRVRYPDWLHTLAIVYRVRFAGREHQAVFLFKTLGGEGRTASALDRLRDRHGGGLLVLNRGEIFVSGHAKTSGTEAGHRFERMGVRAAVVGRGDLYRIQDIFQYRRESPDGVAFLSANLVYSTDTAKTVLPPLKLFTINGKRVAVLGLTQDRFRKYLRTADIGLYALADPVDTALKYVPLLRGSADIVVALTNLSAPENARLKHFVQGLDLIVGDGFTFAPGKLLRETKVRDEKRGASGEALLVTSDFATLLTHVEADHLPAADGGYSLELREGHVFLGESVPDRAGYPKFDPLGYGVASDTRPVLLPSLRRLYGDDSETVGVARFSARSFWNLVAALAADHADAEAGLMPVSGVLQNTTGDYKESIVQDWFHYKDEMVAFEFSGGDLRAMIAETRRQERPGESIPPGGRPVAAGGVDPGDHVHGVSIDPRSVYRVASSRRLLGLTEQYPALLNARNVESFGLLEDVILERLRRGAREKWPVERYRALLEGRPLRRTGLWKVHFREVGLNVSNTKIVRDDAFADVPNARVQGFDELLVGTAFKTDLEYYRGPHKWTTQAELEYSKSRLRPPGGDVLLNTPKNSTMLRSVETLRVGAFPWNWFAKSFGPSFGVQYDGHVERLPLQRRRHIVSVLPGAELFDGELVHSFSLSANLRRDFTPVVPVNQYGARARAMIARSFGTVRLEGELQGNYFFLTPQDTSQDLRLELNSGFKLHIPVYKDFTLSPFIDFYYYMLKTRPIAGYSTITGLSLNFSRLWKPQYESFF